MSEGLHAVIANAVEDAGDVGVESNDTSVETGGEATVTGDTTGGDASSVEQPVEDVFAKEHGLTAKRPDGRENRIPYSRVKAIAEARERKAIAAVAKELGISKAEAELKMEDVMGALTERNTKFTSLTSRQELFDNIEKMMVDEPDEFIRRAAEANPQGYGKFAKVLEAAAAGDPAAQAKVAEMTGDDAEPTPDFDLGNGQFTYSMEGLKKLREYDRRQAAKLAREEFDKEFKPIKERYAAETEREKKERLKVEANEKITATIEKAKKWHKFEENAEEILKVYTADKNMDLFDAYQQVVMPKIAADRTSMRAEILAELKKTPNGTSTQVTAAPAAKDEPKTTADIIRASIAGLKR